MNALAGAAAVVAASVAALCAAADGALLALDVEDRGLDPRLRELAARRERAHRALAFARVAAHLGAGASAAIALHLAPRSTLAFVGLAVALTLPTVLLTETIARSAGDRLGPTAALRLMPVTRAVETVLAPVAMAGGWLEGVLHRVLPPPAVDAEEREATTEQFRQVVAAEAEVSADQEALLNGVFSLGATQVHEIMVPRVNIVGIEKGSPWSEVVDRVRSSEHARLPVFDETLDQIDGLLYAKDVLAPIIEDREPDGGWHSLVRPAVFIPATKPLDEQLRDFKSSRTHMAVVVDEFGGTAGIVTIEDILEEIVGEIRDEYDVEEPEIEQRDERRFWVSGRVTLDALSEVVGQDLHQDDVTTVGGLVYEILGRVPEPGEELNVDGFRVVVERVVRRRVERVYFERGEALSRQGAS